MIEKFPQLGSEQLKKELIEITPEERNWLLEIQKKDKRSKIEEELFVILNYEEKLKSNNNDFCRSISRSLDVLPSISPEIFVRFYKKCLENDDFNVRSSAAKSLGALAPINPEFFLELYKKGLENEDPAIRYATAESLSALASINPELFLELYKKGLENEDPAIRYATAKSLSALAPINPELFVKFFKEGLENENADVRSAIFKSLGSLVSIDLAFSLELYEKGLKDNNENVRIYTAESLSALAPINPELFVKFFKKGLKDKHLAVRVSTAKSLSALASINPQLFIELYKNGLKNKHPEVRLYIAQSLGALAPLNLQLFLKLYKRGLKHEDFDIRSGTAESFNALASVNPELFVKFFKKGLKDQKWHVRSATAQSFDVLAKTIDFSEVKILTNILKKHQVTHSELLFSYACFKSRLKNKGDLKKIFIEDLPTFRTLKDYAKTINPQLSENKKAADLEKFFDENQVRLGKLFGIDSNLAKQFIFSKMKQLGFPLLERILTQLDFLDKESIILIKLINSSENVNEHDLERFFRIYNWEKNLNKFLKLLEKGDFSDKVKRIKIYDTLKNLGFEIEDPNLTAKWLEKIARTANKKIKEIFKIKRELSLNEVLALSQINADKNEIEMISELLDSKIEKNFPLNKIYEKINIRKLKREGDPIEITKSLVPVLLTTEERAKKDIPKHYAKLRKALSFFSAEQLRRARDLIRRKEPGKIFAQLKDDIERLNYNDQEAALRIQTFFKNLAKKELEGKNPRDAEALSDLMDAIESIGKAGIFESLIIKTQKCDATDLLDCRTTACCAFYPDGFNKEASIYYLSDPEICLLWLKSANYVGEELDNLGVAIMVNCEDSEGKRVLLIDSVEGGEALRRIDIKWKEKILESIKKIAKETKKEYIVFNSDVANSTPIEFNKFLEVLGFQKSLFDLKKINGIKAIEKWSTRHYLEAFGGWEFPQGKVNGFRIEIEK